MDQWARLALDNGSNLSGDTPNHKRKPDSEDSGAAEGRFPDHPWFALDHDTIKFQNQQLCQRLINRLSAFSYIDQSIKALVSAAEKAKKLPDVARLRVAVPGEQGIGKSTLLNALVERNILGTSGASKACTSFVTIVVHKPGAANDTTTSDITIYIYSDEEMANFIDEMIRAWCDFHSVPKCDQNTNEDEQHDQNDEDEDGEEEEDDEEEDDPEEISVRRRASTTAKEFFEIIFETEENAKLREWLGEALNHTDIRNENFRGECRESARRVADNLRENFNNNNGAALHKDVPDRKLRHLRNLVLRYWPFVKFMKIATGHPLLSCGLSLYDMPGYGDISQLREAHINKYRKESEFEMVVAPHARFQSSIMHDKYLGRSLRRKTASKTVLVMTKSDELLKRRNFAEQISRVREEPFISLLSRYEELERDGADGKRGCKARYNIYCAAFTAYVKRETRLIQRELNEREIRSFSVSAETYMEWLDTEILEQDPPLDLETCGIDNLRRFLFGLPAANNLQLYHNHVFQVLPKMFETGELVFETHIEDTGYAQMRRDLLDFISNLEGLMESIIARQLASVIRNPLSSATASMIHQRIKNWAHGHWRHPDIYWSGFAKMLRERGIPVNGKYFNRNLNDEILATFQNDIELWYNDMRSVPRSLASILHQVPQDGAVDVGGSIARSSANKELKVKAVEALKHANAQMQRSFNVLVGQLENSLRDTYLHFTTEEDIYCPIAQQMVPVYERAPTVPRGFRVYKRTREAMLSLITPQGDMPDEVPEFPIIENIRDEIVTRLRASWKTHCAAFAKDAVAYFKQFAGTSEQLLQNDAYRTAEHKRARAAVRAALEETLPMLREIQAHLKTEEDEHDSKRFRPGHEEEEDLPDDSDHHASEPGDSGAVVPWSLSRDLFQWRMQ